MTRSQLRCQRECHRQRALRQSEQGVVSRGGYHVALLLRLRQERQALGESFCRNALILAMINCKACAVITLVSLAMVGVEDAYHRIDQTMPRSPCLSASALNSCMDIPSEILEISAAFITCTKRRLRMRGVCRDRHFTSNAGNESYIHYVSQMDHT